MTSKPAPQTPPTGRDKRFPDFPPRDDMQNSIYLDRPAHQAVLSRHFGNPDTTIILSEIPVNLRPSQQRDQRIPDLLIAFNVDPDTAIAQRGYATLEQGKPPDFVLEVASLTTGRNDYVDKRADYAGFGIPEYWRFDPTGGLYHDAPLAGDRLVEGAYQPIAVIQWEENHYWGHSAALGLDLCWEKGHLRWWDPVNKGYLLTYDETDEERILAQARADTEQSARQAVEARADAERSARQAAEARVRELEEELQRRQNPH